MGYLKHTLVVGFFIYSFSALAWLEPARDDLSLRSGYLSGLDLVRSSSCLEDAVPTENDYGNGQKTDFTIQYVSSASELSDHLNLSASTKLNVSKGVASFDLSAKGEFVRNRKASQRSIYLLVKSVVKNGKITLNQHKLKAQYADPNLSYDDFRRACGDSFASAVITGGEYIGVVEFVTKNDETKQVITAQVEAMLDTLAADVEAKFSMNQEKIFKNTQTQINFWSYQAGGGKSGTTPSIHSLPKMEFDQNPTAIDTASIVDGLEIEKKEGESDLNALLRSMITHAKRLPKLVSDPLNAVPIAYVMNDYFSGVQGFPFNLLNRESAKMLNAQRVTENLKKTQLTLLEQANEIQYYLDHPTQYVLTTKSKEQYTDLKLDLEKQVRQAQDMIYDCSMQYELCKIPENLDEQGVADQLSQIVKPKTHLEKAMNYIVKKLGNRCFKANYWGKGICFQFRPIDQAPYYEMIPGSWHDPGKKSDWSTYGTLYADKFYFLKAKGYEGKLETYYHPAEMASLFYGPYEELESATYYFGYHGKYLGIAKVTISLDYSGKEHFFIEESERWFDGSALYQRKWKARSEMTEFEL